MKETIHKGLSRYSIRFHLYEIQQQQNTETESRMAASMDWVEEENWELVLPGDRFFNLGP